MKQLGYLEHEHWSLYYFKKIAKFRSSCSSTLAYSLTFLPLLALNVVKIPGETLKIIPQCSSCLPDNFINKDVGVNFE